MSIFGIHWEKIEIKRIPSIPNGPKRPRKLIPAVFDPDSDDADLDGWRQEGTTARWYGLSVNNPIHRAISAHLKKIEGSSDDSSWLPPGHTNLEEWLGTIEKQEDRRLKAPPLELSTRKADLSFVAGFIDQRTRAAQQRGIDAPNIASESRRAAAWVRGREILRQRAGKSKEVLDDDATILQRAEKLIEELKKKRVERDKKMAKFGELDEETKKLAKNFDVADFVRDQTIDDFDQWSADWELSNPKPIRGDFDTEEDFDDALESWVDNRNLDYDYAVMDERDNSDLIDHLNSIFSFEYEAESGNKYLFTVDDVQEVSGEGLTIQFNIRTASDHPSGLRKDLLVGTCTRTIDNTSGVVHNDYFSLIEQVRGDQISTAIAARNEKIWSLMGMNRIEVSAASSQSMNGATHWPKVGFNWQDADERDYYISLIESALNYFASEIQGNPDELPMIEAKRNGEYIQVPLFASREEAEMIQALINRAKTEDFFDDNALTAGDVVNWSGAEFWFMTRGASVTLVKEIGPEVPSTEVKWLIIEPAVKAVEKPNVPKKPNIPSVPNKPTIGGPSKPRTLIPAVFDPKSVDVDNDGWHQEGTTARWFGAGLNNPVVKQIQKALGQLTDDDRESSYQTMLSLVDFDIYAGAPSPEISTAEADLAWIGGKIVLKEQGPGLPPIYGEPDRSMVAIWLQGREEARRRGGVRQEVLPTPKFEELDDAEVIKALEDIATAKKERRARIDAKTRINAEDYISDDAREAARNFDYTQYPQDENIEILEEADWLEQYADIPEPPEFPFGATPDEMEEYQNRVTEFHERSAAAYDEYAQYRREQENLRDAAIKEAFSPMFEFEFVAVNGKKYSTQVNSVTQSVDTPINDAGDLGTSITIKGQFLNEDGLVIGFFERTFIPDTGMVIHDHMKLDAYERGSQITGIFNSRNEILYREMGYHTIGASALSSGDYNGATHWPKVGFDWTNEDEREAYLALINEALTQFAVDVRDDPNALPMLTKIVENPDGTTSEVKIPLFASREEAESLALLITIANNQDFDDPNRLTAGDFVNWPGAELWFQQIGHTAELSRSIGEIEGQAKKADVADADVPSVKKEIPAILQKSYEDEFKEAYDEARRLWVEKYGSDERFDLPHPLAWMDQNWRRELDELHRKQSEEGFEPLESIFWGFKKIPGIEEPSLETGSMTDDLLYLAEYDNAAQGPDSTFRPLHHEERARYLHIRQAQRRKLAELKDVERHEESDYKIDDAVIPEFKSVTSIELDPDVSAERITESREQLESFQEEMVDRLTDYGAAWRKVVITNSDGEEVTVIRGATMKRSGEVKAAISHQLGQSMSEELELETMIRAAGAISGLEDEQIQDLLRDPENSKHYFAITEQGRIVLLTEGDEDAGKSEIRISPKSKNYKSLVGEHLADNLLGAWASSSDSEISIHVQQAASRIFGLDQVDGVREVELSNRSVTLAGLKDVPEVFDEFVKSQYRLTQSMFAEAGIDSVVTHRGMIWSARERGPLGKIAEDVRLEIKDAEVSLQPISSTAFQRTQTALFASAEAEGALSVVVHSETPVARILSSSLTGIGCLEETELTLIGGGDTRFNLVALNGDSVFSDASEDVLALTLDTHRRGEQLPRFTAKERLERAGYSPEEIDKIQDYMARNGFGDFVPTLSEIQNILNRKAPIDGEPNL